MWSYNDDGQLNTDEAEVSNSRRKVSDTTIGEPPMRSSSVSSSSGDATLSRPIVAQETNMQHNRSRSVRSHTSQDTSHDTHSSSAQRSVSPFDANPLPAHPPPPPPIVTSSSSNSATSNVYTSTTTTDSGSQHQRGSIAPSLARSGSIASTIPTSPETELSQSLLRTASYDKDTAVATSEEGAALTRNKGDRSTFIVANERPQAPVQVAKVEQEIHSNSPLNAFEEDVSKPALTRQRLDRREQPTFEVQTGDSTIDLPRQRHRASIAHRNKPLPIPAEVRSAAAITAPHNAAKQRAGQSSTSANRVAHGQVSPLVIRVENGDKERVFSDAADLAGQAFSVGKRSANLTTPTTMTATTPARGSLMSMMSKSSNKLFRGSAFMDRDALAPWSPDVALPARQSDSSLLLPYSAATSATTTSSAESQTHFADSSSASSDGSHRSAAHTGSQGGAHNVATVLTPPTASRSPSPFQVMRNARSRPTSDPNQKTLRTRSRSNLSPSSQNGHDSQPLSLTSSSSSLVSASPPLSQQQILPMRAETPIQKRPSISVRLSQHFGTVFGGSGEMSSQQQQPPSSWSSPLRNVPIKGSTPQEDGSLTVAAAMAEASRKLHQTRPRLTRLRSQSMDDMQRALHPEAVKSLAVGTVSVITPERGASLVLNRHVEDEGDAARRVEASSTLEGREGTLSRLGGESREGTLSRLAGSLRRRPPPSKIPIKTLPNGNSKHIGDSSSSPWATISLKHRRNRSHAMPASTPTMITGGDQLPRSGIEVVDDPMQQPAVPPKEYENVSPERKETWWDTTKQSSADVQGHGSKDSTFSQFEAAHLAIALSAGDGSVEARLAAAADSPKTCIAPLYTAHTQESTSISADLVRTQSSAYHSLESEPDQLESTDDCATNTSNVDTADAPVGRARTSHRRALSLGKVLEPLVGLASMRSDRAQYEPDSLDSSVSSNYESAASISNVNGSMHDESQPGDATNVSGGKRGLYALTPPSSFNALRYAHLTKSGSEPLLDLDSIASDSAYGEVVRRGSETTIKGEGRDGGGHVRRSSASDAHMKSDTQTRVRISPSPLARTRKISTPSAPSSRRKAFGDKKPELTLDTSSFHSEPMFVRPSSAMGMSAHLERNMHRNVQRHPTLSIADDLEFLQALEHVRRDNQNRIKRQHDDARKYEELVRFNLVPLGKRRVSGSDAEQADSRYGLNSAYDVVDSLGSACAGDANQTTATLVESPLDEEDLSVSTLSPSRTNARSISASSAHRPSPLELGVGKASGKMRDGAFLNDEDWKKEVKALFVIRELVLTERSYAAYLESLLHAIRQMNVATPGRRSTTPSLMMTSTASNGSGNGNNNSSTPVPSHIVLMRNLLPQLITLSRTLANRIDENPTAAGVGAAFRLVSTQMEATFVAWSAAITEIMQALRTSEAPKAKARGRIGLIGIHVEQNSTLRGAGDVANGSSFSVPSSPIRARMLVRDSSAKSLVNPTDTVRQDVSQQSCTDYGSSSSNGTHSAKRRSTMSSLPPSMAASIRAKLNAGNALSSPTSASSASGQYSPTAVLDDIAMPGSASSAGTTSQNVHRRSSTASTSPPTLRKGVIGSSNQFLASTSSFLDNALSMSPASLRSSGTTTPNPTYNNKSQTTASKSADLKHARGGGTFEASHSKKLTAMDVAIMPTQRLPRYLLLLRDLHVNTPPQSLSNVRLQRSLDFVHRVAGLCDRASKTAAHYRPTNAR